MALLGPEGLSRVAGHCYGQLATPASGPHKPARAFRAQRSAFPRGSDRASYHGEGSGRSPAERRILFGVALSDFWPERTHEPLVRYGKAHG